MKRPGLLIPIVIVIVRVLCAVAVIAMLSCPTLSPVAGTG